MNQIKSNRVLALIFMLVITLVCGMMISIDWADAASGKVGGCAVSRNYRHPDTGVIEDSGGEGSFATGQGMVESCVYSYGMLEETTDGQCYFTVRLTLQDLVSNVSFSSQARGSNGWSSLGTTVTNQGADNSGVTKDYCIKVPSTNCVVRCSMYVQPMGRTVIYYLSPSGFNEGNTNGMVATHVTSQPSGKDTEKPKETAKDNKQDIAAVEKKIDAIGEVTIKKEDKIREARMAYDSLKPNQQKKVKNYDILKKAEEKLSELKAKEIEKPDVDKTLNSAKGLTLSTEKEQPAGNGSTAAIVLGVIVLIAAAGGGGYYVVQRKKKGSGDTRDDDQ